MAVEPGMRASDDDRDRVASVLREHYAQGRLDSEEFGERLERLYASKTYGELATLTSDLPDVDLSRLPAAAPAPSKDVAPKEDQRGLTAAWGAWAMASSVNWGIWFIIGATDGFDFPYPWPLWVMGPWGIILLISTIVGGQGKGRNQR
ncbi:hypothetical protein FHS43_000700 [Streptosporangium becharense]|uniref:DUF1707 domain-containing protein n=1 Tax=Streptosporangium becharense TaxID=1816182 RepID=A0A7W9IF50_9ACTN|nr:DUF1707 domain-containing protein [Streptosporangium becharense]MBB2909454.1 hypothetical protein [Streptosporangium becharense]MBB5819589.1 hypothetical protein [Streptosporangium becharense]